MYVWVDNPTSTRYGAYGDTIVQIIWRKDPRSLLDDLNIILFL